MTGDMTAIPSLTIEKLLDKAKNSPNLSSVQLQEALENSGLVNYEIGNLLQYFETIVIFPIVLYLLRYHRQNLNFLRV